MTAIILYKENSTILYQNITGYNSWRPPHTLTLWFENDTKKIELDTRKMLDFRVFRRDGSWAARLGEHGDIIPANLEDAIIWRWNRERETADE